MTRPGQGPRLGLALLAAHVVLFPLFIVVARRTELAVELGPGGSVAPDGLLSVNAAVDEAVARRTRLSLDGLPMAGSWPIKVGPGLHRVEWGVTYGGGFERRVGVTKLIGPLQSFKKGACGIRLRLGELLLDDGRAAPGTFAYMVKRGVERDADPSLITGDFTSVRRVRLWWSEADTLRGTIAEVDADGTRFLSDRTYAVKNSLRASIVIEFERVTVPVEVAAIPTLTGGRLQLRAVVAADAVGHGAVTRAIIKLFGRKGAARRAGAAVSKVLDTIEDSLSVPPPIALGKGRVIRLAYCKDQPIRITEGSSASVPLTVLLEPGPTGVTPIHLPRSSSTVPPTAAPISVDLDLNAVNAILYDLWAIGFLDIALSKHIPDWFNEDDTVREWLSIRLSSLRLTLPPTVELANATPLRFKLGAEAALKLIDGELSTPAKLYGRVGFALGLSPDNKLDVDLSLDDLVLTCEPAGILRPCYSDLVDGARSRIADVHGKIGAELAKYVEGLTRGRSVRPSGGSIRFDVNHLRVSSRSDAPSGWFRIDVFAKVRD